MSKVIFIVGANSAMARATNKELGGENTIITGGRKNCDVYCDITKPFDIPHEVDVVLNFAAAFGGVKDDEFVDAVSVNSLGMVHVCIAAKKANVSHIINISSLSAVHDKESPYYSVYSISKKTGDDLAQLYCTLNNITLTVLQPSQVYGDDDSFASHQPFFYQIVDKAQKGEDVVIYGSHDALRNYIHISDINELIKRVIELSIEGIYPCMYPSNITYSQLAKKVQDTFAAGGSIRFRKDKPDTPDNIFEMNTSIYERTGYEPQISIEDGLQRIKSYQQGVIV